MLVYAYTKNHNKTKIIGRFAYHTTLDINPNELDNYKDITPIAPDFNKMKDHYIVFNYINKEWEYIYNDLNLINESYTESLNKTLADKETIQHALDNNEYVIDNNKDTSKKNTRKKK